MSGNQSVTHGGSSRPPKVSDALKSMLKESVRDDLIITPGYEQFMAKWDEIIDPEVASDVARRLSIPDRDRRYSWSASAAANPLRHQELQFLGVPTSGNTYDPRLQRIFYNGTWFHLRTQAVLMTAGLLDQIEIRHRKKSKRIRCTMDGMGTAPVGRYVGASFGLELKSRNEWAFRHQVLKGVDVKTRAQVDFMFMLTGFDLFVVLNENKNTQELKEWVFVRDEDRIDLMRDQVKELNRAIDKRRLHPVPDECKKNKNDCPWGGAKGVCGNVGRWPSISK